MHFEPLLLPRLQQPRVQKSLLRREHLLQLLDRGLEYKVTMLAGPAGSGKTTAVAQWLTERKAQWEQGSSEHAVRVAYLTLDEGDNDPIRFWRYMIAACQRLDASVGKEALDLLLASRLPPFKPLDMMLTVLLNELSQIEHPCLLVLDDFHVLTSEQVRETFSFFLDHLPVSFHLFILVRGEPMLSLTRLRTRNDLFSVYPPYLYFSLEETRTLFERELPFPLSASLLRQVYDKLNGWPAGIRLFTNTLQLIDSEHDFEHMIEVFPKSYESVRDYFLSEVLQTMPEAVQAFLLQTSVFPLLTPSLCDAVLHRSDSDKQIAALYNSDLFLIPTDATGEWGRYQSIFAGAMQQEARKRLGEEQLRTLAEAASHGYEQHALLTEAIETALYAELYTRAAHLIQETIDSNQQNPMHTLPELYNLKGWLEALPEDVLEDYPDLCLSYAMTLLFIYMEDSRLSKGKERVYSLLHIAEQHWRNANNTAKLAEVFSFHAMLARQEGKILQAVTWAKQALLWLPAENLSWRSVALTVVGTGEILDGNLKEARGYLLEALALNEHLGNVSYTRAIRGMLNWVNMEQGRLHQAAEMYRQMQVEARTQADLDDIARSQLGLADIMYQWNQLPEAYEAAQEALAIGERMHEEEFQALATIRLALIEHAQGQTMQARQRLLTWLTAQPTPTMPYSYQLRQEVQAAQAYLSLLNDDLIAVQHWSDAVEQRTEAIPLLSRQREHLLQFRLAVAQGETRSVLEGLERLHAAAQQTDHLLLSMETYAVLALAYTRTGSVKDAQRCLLTLLKSTRGENYLRLYLNEGEEMMALLQNLLPSLHEKSMLAYVRRILDTFDENNRGTTTAKSNSSHTTSRLVEPLSSREREVLRLLAAGHSNGEIARELVVSVNTVRTQVQSIYHKLNVNNRVEASAVARELELL